MRGNHRKGDKMKYTHGRAAAVLAVSTLIAAGSAIAISAPAEAAPAGYCNQGWTTYQTGPGIITITSGLRTGPLLGCASNGLAYQGDVVTVDCLGGTDGWGFVEDHSRGNRGWIPYNNFDIYIGYSYGTC
jgi:hypothetical protein